jgi:hypothetical protein
MQYILTEEEYNHLKAIKTAQVIRDRAKLQKFCTFVADNLPVRDWRLENNNNLPTPWGFIITENDYEEWYCDECPSQEICPCEQKQWSK